MDSQLFSLAKTYFILSNVLTALILFSFIVYGFVLVAKMIQRNRRRERRLQRAEILNQIRLLVFESPGKIHHTTRAELHDLIEKLDDLI